MEGMQEAQRLYDMQTDINGFVDEDDFEEALTNELSEDNEIDQAEWAFAVIRKA